MRQRNWKLAYCIQGLIQSKKSTQCGNLILYTFSYTGYFENILSFRCRKSTESSPSVDGRNRDLDRLTVRIGTVDILYSTLLYQIDCTYKLRLLYSQALFTFFISLFVYFIYSLLAL